MRKRLLKLNLQFFGEGGDPGTDPGTGAGTGAGAGTGEGAGSQGNAATIDYDKIQAMIDRGTAQKESAILKSYFDQLGLTGDEAKQALEAFKAQKAEKSVNLQKENEQLKAQILQGKVDTAVNKAASELGISAANIPYVTKLADLKGATNDKGEVDEKVISDALKKVLEDVPAFKTADPGNPTGFQVGGKGSDPDKADEAEKRLRAAFGLK